MIERIGVTPLYADATLFAGLVQCVEVPAVEAGDITRQMESLLAALETTLQRSGSSKSNLLMATIYLCDMQDYAAMNAVWQAWLPAGCAPARACVEVSRLARSAWRVEIAVMAARVV